MLVEDLYDRAIEVLGTSPEDFMLAGLAQELEDEAVPISKNEHMSSFLLRKSGLQFLFDERDRYYAQVFIHFGSAMAESGTVTRYDGDLPYGIRFGDTRNDVKDKLGLKPIRSTLSPGRTSKDPKDKCDSYDMDPLEVTFIFKGATGRLSSISIWHQRWLKQYNKG